MIWTRVPLVLAGLVLPLAANAQVMFDTTRVTCADYLAMSFRQEKDRQRVAAQARAQCKLPYTIARGPTGGVMMHVADDSALYELRPKGGSDGKTYLGLEAPPGHVQDREILSISEREMVMRFADPDANNRYGTFVYVRCAA